MVLGDTLERRDSGSKRKRLSERRRAFSRLSGRCAGASRVAGRECQHSSGWQRGESYALSSHATTSDADAAYDMIANSSTGSIAMKIQFHIRVAPENEPLILGAESVVESQNEQQAASVWDQQQLSAAASASRKYSDANIASPPATTPPTRQSIDVGSAGSSIGEHIHERLLSRQNSSSTKRRQQLLAMHKLSTTSAGSPGVEYPPRGLAISSSVERVQQDQLGVQAACEAGASVLPVAKDVRSSTITDGMPTDEATEVFLARHQRFRPTHDEDESDSLERVHRKQQQQQEMQMRRNTVQQLEQYGGSSGGLFEQRHEPEHIYFKRDGRRFGHEFTMKLSVERNYRCLLKVRPLMALQSILVQGQPVQFVDCSSAGSAATLSEAAGSATSAAASAGLSLAGLSYRSAPALSRSWQNIHNSNSSGSNKSNQQNIHNKLSHHNLHQQHHHNHNNNHNNNHNHNHNNNNHQHQHHQNHHQHQQQQHSHHNNYKHLHTSQAHEQHQPVQSATTQLRSRLNHAQTVGNVSQAGKPIAQLHLQRSSLLPIYPSKGLTSMGSQLEAALARHQLRQQQFNQMLRSFAGSHSSSSCNSQLGAQLVYMFDWSASGQFEVNKNKVRTLVQTVLKFKNGQMLTLPLQVKFYPHEARQHLNWGSQLHYIDYDCTINDMGAINVDRVQYY